MKKDIKKYLYLLVTSVFLFTLLSCRQKDTQSNNIAPTNTQINTSSSQTNTQEITPLHNNDFLITYNNLEIKLDDSVEDLINKIGSGTANEKNNLGFIGWDKDKKYKYNSHGYPKTSPDFFIITKTNIENGEVIIFEIDITSKGTKSGINKDSNIDDILKIYGEPSEKIELEDSTINYIYSSENKALVFNINKETNKISKISLRHTPVYEIQYTK